jgi:hypothetical protein
MSKIRKMFLHPLHLCLLMIKYGIVGAVVMSELDLVFWLFKPLFMTDKTGWSGLLLVIVIAGLNIAVYLLLRRFPIEWERFEPKNLAKKILGLDEIHN